MLNSKEKRTLKKFQFKKEVVANLNDPALNSVNGGANTVQDDGTILFFCPIKGFSDFPCTHGTDHTDCYCSSSKPC